MSFVLDNSVALAWCFEDEQTEAIMALLDRVTDTGAFAPQLWPVEALNGLLMAERRKRIDAARRHQLAGFLAELPIAIDGETATRLWHPTAQLAEDHKLTAYDATYLELALRLDLPLATSDKPLIAAAQGSGIPLLPTR
jgi:predicted nucleic acid-binding protein